MNRRDFLMAGTLAVAGAIVPRALAAVGHPQKLKKGIWYADVPGDSVLEKFQNAKAAGFEGIEPPSDLNEEEVLKARDESGLVIPSVACGQYARVLSHPDPSRRAEGVDGVRRTLRKASSYGASSILAVPGGVTKEVSYSEAWERTLAEFRKVVPLAEELGVKIAFENVWNHFLLSPIEAARFVDALQSPAAGWQFDVGNMMHLGWPEHWIEILGKRIQKVHIKEFSRTKMTETGFRAGFDVEFLEGDCDWPAIMQALRKIGYSGWAIVEPAWRPKGIDRMARLRTISGKLDRILAM